MSSAYRTTILTTPEQIAALAPTWEQLRQRHPQASIEHSPNWLGLATEPTAKPLAVALYRGDELVGVASFVVKPWRWHCLLGYKTVAKFPVTLADLCGDTLLAPDDLAAHEVLLNAAADAVDFDLILMEGLPENSPLWRAVFESPVVRRRFWAYRPAGSSQRRIIRLSGTFQDYLQQFNPKTRGNIRRCVKKIEQACTGQMRVERITTRDQLPKFLKSVEEISAKSWQGTRLGWVVRNRAAENERFGKMADQGWLRSYLLSNGEQPIAFVLSWQDIGVFYYDQIGYDPAWAKLTPGTVLLQRLLEDLFTHNPPQYLDFRYGDGTYKRIFSNHDFPEANVYLIRKSFYTGLLLATDKTLRAFARGVRWSLDHLKLREKVRHILRGRSQASVSAAK